MGTRIKYDKQTLNQYTENLQQLTDDNCIKHTGEPEQVILAQKYIKKAAKQLKMVDENNKSLIRFAWRGKKKTILIVYLR